MKLPKPPAPTRPAFAFSAVDRALHQGLSVRRFSQEEMGQVVNFFGKDPPECVYCGGEVERWDHLVPVRKGGETALGNMVPVCARCDDSKQDSPFDEWMLSDCSCSPKSRDVKDIEERIERMKAYAQHFAYTPRSLEQRLNEDELERLEAIRSMLRGLRTVIEALIADYQARTSTLR